MSDGSLVQYLYCEDNIKLTHLQHEMPENARF